MGLKLGLNIISDREVMLERINSVDRVRWQESTWNSPRKPGCLDRVNSVRK